MKNKVLKLAKRLGKFCIDDISQIITADEVKLKELLQDLINEESIIQRTDSTYFYQEKFKIKKSTLPLFFEFHTPNEIDLIVKCFCAGIEVGKVINISGLKRTCINKFYRYFRELIYSNQLKILKYYFLQKPQIAQERVYFGKTYHLYLYDSKLFVSDNALRAKNTLKFTDSERLKIKTIYLRANRKVLNNSYKHCYPLHLAEELWRVDKSFDVIIDNLHQLLTA